MKKIFKRLSVIVAIMLSISTFTMSVSAATTMSSLSVMNAIYNNGSYTAISSADTINKTSSANDSYKVTKLTITGTISTSQTGVVTNKLRIYNGKNTFFTEVVLPTSGTFTVTVNVPSILMRDMWYFQLISERTTPSGIAATTIKNGHVTFHY